MHRRDQGGPSSLHKPKVEQDITPDSIHKLIGAGESLSLEFKAIFPKNATEIAQDIAAFSNTHGGTILIGVTDEGDVVGVTKTDETMQRIVGAANSICKPSIRPAMGKTTLENGKQVVWVRVAKNCEALTMVYGKCYVRNGPVAVPVEDSNELKRLLPKQKQSKSRLAIGIISVLSVVFLSFALVNRPFSKRRLEQNSVTRSTDAKRSFELAVSYETRGDDEQAISALEDAIRTDPSFGEAYLRAAYLCQQDDRFDDAVNFLKRADQSPEAQDPRFARRVKAMHLYLDGDDDKALQEYKLLTDAAPQDSYSLYYYADLAWEMGRFEEAKTALDRCLQNSAFDPLCNFDEMMLQVSNNNFDDVLESSKRLAHLGVDYPWFDLPVGLALVGRDEIQAADEKFSHFGDLSKNFHGSLHFVTAQEYKLDLLTYQGKIADARSLVYKVAALETQEERAGPLLDMAMADAVLGNKQEAIAEVNEAHRISAGDYSRSRTEKVLAIVGAGKNPEQNVGKTAKGESAVRIGPLDSDFIIAMRALREGRANVAVRYLEFARQKDDDSLYGFFLGQAYMQARDWGKAADEMRKVQEAKGRILSLGELPVVAWPLTFYYAGRCNEELRRQSQAESSYRRFLQLWHDADSNLRQIGDARLRLNRLSAKKF